MSLPLASVLQRLPAISHFLILILAIYGPYNFPLLYASTRFFVHIVLFAHQILSAWGQFCAWRGVEATCYPKTYKTHDLDHIIIIPTYKEELELLRETLDVFASHLQTRDRYRICLAMESREVGSEKKAIQLKSEYIEVFAEFDYSIHPVINGEAPGKSSNVNWAARHMAAKFDVKEHMRQIITVIDSDTCLAQDYFQMVADRFMAASPVIRSKMMFCVPIVFDRNAHEVPIFVRLTDILWCQAGLSTTYPSSGIKIPTSTYGISMQLANDVGFWDTGPDAIGEDMHMFTKCFLSTGGSLHVETIYSPASQLNVVGSRHAEGGISAWVSDMCARYSQGMRHVVSSLFLLIVDVGILRFKLRA
jgi:Glycosyl transferase family group 2